MKAKPSLPARILLFLALTWSAATTAAPQDDAVAIWRLLDYLAVDYPEAVADGQVINAGEYAEMQEFVGDVQARLPQLPEHPSRARLVADAEALRAAIGAKAPPADIAQRARGLMAALTAAYTVTLSPATAPDLTAAPQLYEAQCAACHGTLGRGDGTAGIGMEPAPIDFHDAGRRDGRSVFALYGTITAGVEGTGMPAFTQLDEAQRWALAFHVGQMSYTDTQRARGRQAWEADPRLRAALPTLAALTSTSPEHLAQTLGPDDADAIMAWLRANPQAALPPAGSALQTAQRLVRESADAYAAGERKHAADLALAAYLDGFEPSETGLGARDPALVAAIEAGMLRYRGLIQSGAPTEAVADGASEIVALLERAHGALEGRRLSPGSAFTSSFVLLFREGLEAVLVLVAIVTGLRRTGRMDAMKYVHAGWVSALVLGLLTWAAATWLITVSGAQRELTEGITGVIAVAILIFVGLWMHSQALSGRWQAYVSQVIRTQLTRNRLWGLALLAFVAVYREAFEVVLFYRALWEPQAQGALLAGIGAAVAALALISWALFRAGARLPIRQFFLASSILIAILAVMLAGKAAAALQEAGWLGVTPWAVPTLDWLGMYPTVQTLAAQLAVGLVVLLGIGFNLRRPRPAVASETSASR